MKTKFSGFLTLFLAFVVQFTFAQEKTISGTVTDESGPLPGVSVIIKGTTTGTETDFDGKYTIAANTGDVLVYSFIGMTTKENTVGTDATMNIVMASDNVLEEVIITALGLEKKKDDDLSSSTTVNTDALNRAAESGVIQGLAGKTSGLKITKNSGDPGAGAYIQIRGQNTINGDFNPLIILDGSPISNTSVGGSGGNTADVTQQSRLNDINQDDIESVTVLKGAAAAAVWGTGAANGVIIIKTKQGHAGGKKIAVSVRSTIAIDKINIEFDKQDSYGQGYNLALFGVGNDFSSDSHFWVPNTGFSWGDKISNRSGAPNDVVEGNERFVSSTGNIIYPIDNKNSTNTYNKSNKDLVFGDGFTFDKSVGISFAGENSNTFMSFSDWDQKGIIKGRSNYRRQTIRLNQSMKLTDKFSAKFNVTYSKIGSDRVQQGSNLSGLYLGYLRTSPDFDNTDYKGTYYNGDNIPTLNSQRSYRSSIGGFAPVYNNPLWTIKEQDNPNKVNRFIMSPELVWKFKENMSLTARYGLDYYTDHRETLFPVNSAAGNSIGFFRQDDIQEKTQNINIFINSSHEISDDFTFGWILGTTLDENEYSRLSGQSSSFSNPAIGDLRIFGNAGAADEAPFSFKSKTKKSGAYAILSTEFYNQLFIEASGRYERSSALESNVFYPSVSLGWKFTELLGANDFLSFGKLRVAYGEVGIEPSAYLTKDLFSAFGIRSTWGDFLDAGAYSNPFGRQDTKGNPDLKEERIKETEFGVDLRFFNNRVTLGATYYDRTTEDALLQLDLAPTTGYLSEWANAATISNKGLELDLGLKLITEGDFKWSLNANYSHNKNLVTDLSGVQSVFLAGFTGTSSRVVEGHPIGTLWGGKFEHNADGSYVLNSIGFPALDPEEGVLGDPNPDWIGGLGTVVSYKGLTLSAQFETSQGNDHWTGTEGVLKYFGIHKETAVETTATADLLNSYGETIPAGTTFRGSVQDFGGGPVAIDNTWYTGNGGGFGGQGETFVQDASWSRLRELSLGYQFPEKWVSKVGFSDISLTVTGRNLILWTEIEGFDPDLNLTGGTLGRGLDYFTNPATKSYAFTLKFGF